MTTITNAWLGFGRDTLQTGGVLESEQQDLIREGIVRLLQTKPGEAPLEPTRGNYAFEYLHLPMVAAVGLRIAYSCLECISYWEDRVWIDLEATIKEPEIDELNGIITVSLEYVWADTLQREILNVTFPIIGLNQNTASSATPIIVAARDDILNLSTKHSLSSFEIGWGIDPPGVNLDVPIVLESFEIGWDIETGHDI
jgi:phage baseplate assembly protein W